MEYGEEDQVTAIFIRESILMINNVDEVRSLGHQETFTLVIILMT